jgi:hypothetical protein
MLIVLLALTNLGQALTEITSFINDAIRRRIPVRDIPCARSAPCPVMLSSHLQVGQHEKNANPIRPEHRSTR